MVRAVNSSAREQGEENREIEKEKLRKNVGKKVLK